MKLKNSIILKKVNDHKIFAIDCESEEDSFFKFEDVSKFFLEALHSGSSPQEILKKAADQFPAIPSKDIEKDLNDFIQTIKDFGITQL